MRDWRAFAGGTRYATRISACEPRHSAAFPQQPTPAQSSARAVRQERDGPPSASARCMNALPRARACHLGRIGARLLGRPQGVARPVHHRPPTCEATFFSTEQLLRRLMGTIL